ncbi:MAG: CPBP family intramembrane glutamic endopeptidase [Pseudomonadota bacterium]
MKPSLTASQSALIITFAGTAGMGVIAYALSALFGVSLNDQFSLSVKDALLGIAATAPPALLLLFIMRTKNPFLVSFRKRQIEYFAELPFSFSPLFIITASVAAGIFEEMLFRGFLQTTLALYMPLAAAILLSNIVFGLLHWNSAFTAALTGLVGVYLGVIFAVTGNLLTVMIAHGLYDILAMTISAPLIRRAKNAKMPDTDDTSL